MDEALALMRRDAGEAPDLVVLMLLPVALSAYAGMRGSRLAVVPILVFAGQMSWWFAYHATAWVSLAVGGSALLMAVLTTVGSLVLGVAAMVGTFDPRRGPESAPLDPWDRSSEPTR
jgi:hypothetical protein